MPSAKLLFGPMLIGVFFNTILYGVLVVQVLLYFQTYKDSAWIRFFILYLFVLETCNTVFDIAMMYEPLILNFGTPDAITYFPTMIAADPIITVAIATPIQFFVAWRISIISRSWLMPALICIIGVISLAGGIWTCITVATIRVFSRKPELHWPALTWLLASAIADALITSTLVYSLYKRKTGFKDTDSVIERVIRFTIQTGLITALFAILDVVFFLVSPHTTLNFIWDLALGKLYSNVLMSTLNSRAGWDRIANPRANHNVLFGDETSTSLVITNTRFRNSRKSINEPNPRPLAAGRFEMVPELSHVVGRINPQHDILDLSLKGNDLSSNVSSLSR
ncbi:hypothetical protein BDN71DRAFT_1452425 [Pleurotus eryngii]|uniref:DUF6534 domain-containing protein n=1 Tax=Pleurotus eryngii TaxID=5323 RepID=A0A9P5ZQB4_PLEER|nr:hypothetical protein BDN71DRAFT_1452425 [Pleurotus eryngii]